MELGRNEQINDLMDRGWFFDEECEQKQMSRRSAGGLTYIKSPQGVLYEVGYGTTKPVTS